LIGLILAAIYGAFVWPMIAMVAFSRKDFTSAIESFIRAIPPPFGDTIADSFLEANRMIARMNANRVKLVNDITGALLMIADLIDAASARINSGIERVNSNVNAVKSTVTSATDKISTLSNRIVEAADAALPGKKMPRAEEPTPEPRKPRAEFEPTPEPRKPRAEFEPTPVGKGRKRLTTKRRSKHNKWPTKRTRSARR
jgi:hypothetical protein